MDSRYKDQGKMMIESLIKAWKQFDNLLTLSKRMEWLVVSSNGLCIDVGSHSGSYGFSRFARNVAHNVRIEKTVSIDIDIYKLPLFVRCEASNLPFRNKCFDNAIGGELLEHNELDLADKILGEMVRISNRILLTFPYEEKWDKEKVESERPEKHHNALNADIRIRDALKYTQYYVDDRKFKHVWHIREAKPNEVIESVKKYTNTQTKITVGLTGQEVRHGNHWSLLQ